MCCLPLHVNIAYVNGNLLVLATRPYYCCHVFFGGPIGLVLETTIQLPHLLLLLHGCGAMLLNNGYWFEDTGQIPLSKY